MQIPRYDILRGIFATKWHVSSPQNRLSYQFGVLNHINFAVQKKKLTFASVIRFGGVTAETQKTNINNSARSQAIMAGR